MISGCWDSVVLLRSCPDAMGFTDPVMVCVVPVVVEEVPEGLLPHEDHPELPHPDHPPPHPEPLDFRFA